MCNSAFLTNSLWLSERFPLSPRFQNSESFIRNQQLDRIRRGRQEFKGNDMSSDEEDYGLDETDSGNESPDDEDVENDDFVMDIGLGKSLNRTVTREERKVTNANFFVNAKLFFLVWFSPEKKESCHSAIGEEAGGGPSGSGMGAGADKRDDEYQYEVLTTEQIVEFMVKELKEVQNVIQVRRRLEEGQ